MVSNNHNAIFNKVASLINKITDLLKLDFCEIFDLALKTSHLIVHNNKANVKWIRTHPLLSQKEGQ